MARKHSHGARSTATNAKPAAAGAPRAALVLVLRWAGAGAGLAPGSLRCVRSARRWWTHRTSDEGGEIALRLFSHHVLRIAEFLQHALLARILARHGLRGAPSKTRRALVPVRSTGRRSHALFDSAASAMRVRRQAVTKRGAISYSFIYHWLEFGPCSSSDSLLAGWRTAGGSGADYSRYCLEIGQRQPPSTAIQPQH